VSINPNQVPTTMFGMASAVFTSTCAMLVTTAVRSNAFIDKSMNVLIHGVAAAENVAAAVEVRSKIYGEGMIENGKLSEREILLKTKMRLANLEKHEAAVAAGTAEYTPAPSFGDQFANAIKRTRTAVVGSVEPSAADTGVQVTSAVQ